MAGLRKGSNWQDVQWGLFMSKYIFPGADASTPLYWYTKELEKAGFEVGSLPRTERARYFLLVACASCGSDSTGVFASPGPFRGEHWPSLLAHAEGVV